MFVLSFTLTRKAARCSSQPKMPDKWLQKRFAGDFFFLIEGRWKRYRRCVHTLYCCWREHYKSRAKTSRGLFQFSSKCCWIIFVNGGRPSGALMLYTTAAAAAAYDLVESLRIQENRQERWSVWEISDDGSQPFLLRASGENLYFPFSSSLNFASSSLSTCLTLLNKRPMVNGWWGRNEFIRNSSLCIFSSLKKEIFLRKNYQMSKCF